VIVDSSAIISILRLEPEAQIFLKKLDTTSRCLIAAPTYLEVCMVMAGTLGEKGQDDVDQLLSAMDILIVPFTPTASKVAVSAFLTYGKGRGHKAQLNFGDCISYAMSKVEAMPLLFKGEDFALTDVERAV
jgi:ribonuclease VapC